MGIGAGEDEGQSRLRTAHHLWSGSTDWDTKSRFAQWAKNLGDSKVSFTLLQCALQAGTGDDDERGRAGQESGSREGKGGAAALDGAASGGEDSGSTDWCVQAKSLPLLGQTMFCSARKICFWLQNAVFYRVMKPCLCSVIETSFIFPS